MNATLLFQQKESKDCYIREMIVWRLGKPVPGCRHLFKFRLYFGTDNGECLVRYDNERGEGVHKQISVQSFRTSPERWKRLLQTFLLILRLF